MHSHHETNLFLVLEAAPRKLVDRWEGTLRWALDAEDVCYLVQVAVELANEWGTHSPAEVWARAAGLLGVPTTEPASH